MRATPNYNDDSFGMNDIISEENRANKKKDTNPETQGMSYAEKHVYDLSKPFCLTNIMVNQPVCCICFALLIMVAISGITFLYDWVLPNDSNQRDFLVWGSDVVNDFDKKLLITEYLKET